MKEEVKTSLPGSESRGAECAIPLLQPTCSKLSSWISSLSSLSVWSGWLEPSRCSIQPDIGEWYCGSNQPDMSDKVAPTKLWSLSWLSWLSWCVVVVTSVVVIISAVVVTSVVSVSVVNITMFGRIKPFWPSSPLDSPQVGLPPWQIQISTTIQRWEKRLCKKGIFENTQRRKGRVTTLAKLKFGQFLLLFKTGRSYC